MSKPTGKFEFNSKGNGFSVGGASAGESVDAVTAGVSKMGWKPKGKKQAQEEEEEEEEEEEDDEEGDMVDLPKDTIRRIKAVRNLHSEYEDIEAAYKKERIELEKKFLISKNAYLEKRRKLVSGETEVLPDPSDETEENAGSDEPSDVKGIPGFWLTTLTSNGYIAGLITDEDVPALESLTDITVDYNDTFDTFTLSFHFAENEFFTNSVLTKTYTVHPDLLDDKAPSLNEVKGTEIEWKPKKNLLVSETTKKQKAKSGRNKGQVKTVTVTEEKASFFHYFSDPMSDEEAMEAEEKAEEDEEFVNFKLSMEDDYDIGHQLRTVIIPEAVLYYTGEAMEDDDEDEENEEEGDEEEDDEEEEDEEDEEEEEARPAPRKGGKNKGGSSSAGMTFSKEGGFAAKGNDAEGKPECKQN